MIKIIAALFMFVDHVGAIYFPTSYMFRIVGRLSMPLFAYCIARGFHYSFMNGTLKTYIYNIAGLAVISQIPYLLMQNGDLGSGFNICVTWLFSLLLLFVINDKQFANKRYLIVSVTIITIAIIQLTPYIHTDYGLYGVLIPVVFYIGFFENKIDTYKILLYMIVLWGYRTLIETNGSSLLQIISILAVPLLVRVLPYDNKVKVSKWIYYLFYPLHITMLVLLKHIIDTV